MKRVIPFISNIVSIFILLGILFAYAMFQGGFVSWFLFYSFLPIFLYHFILLFYPLANWTISREFSQNMLEAGDAVTITVHVERSTRFPIYYAVLEEILADTMQRKDLKNNSYHYMKNPEELATKREVKKMLFIGFKKHFTFTYTLEELPRGEHHLSQLRVRMSDVLGFVKKEHTFTQSSRLQVRPKEREMILPKTLAAFEQGARAANSPLQDHTNVVTGVRDYAPGDRFSWIHWKQSAKSNAMMTKEFEQERGTNILLILDAHHSETINRLAFEATIEITLAFLKRMERIGVDAGLFIMGKEITYFPAHYKKTAKEKIIDYFMRMEADGESLALALSKNRAKLRGARHVVILTSELDVSAVTTLKQLQQQVRIVLFYVQSSHSMNKQEREWVVEMQEIGIQVYPFTEKELVETPIEVKV